MIEMKRSVGRKTLFSIKEKVRADDNRASIRLPTGEQATSPSDEGNNDHITLKLLGVVGKLKVNDKKGK